jgi:hypothetical protein
MLTWAHPWVLLGLAAVATAAVWALWRPGRQEATVATLEFWRAAQQHLAASARRRSRRISLHWLLLLLGAVCGVLAAAGPRIETDAPSRRIALKLVIGAELGQGGMNSLRSAVNALLNRLDPADRVALLTPTGNPPADQWLSPGRARSAVSAMVALPVAADDLTLPAPPTGARQTVNFATARINAGPRDPDTILLPTDLPPVTFDAIGAADLPDGKTQLFLALRNHTGQPRRVKVALGGIHAGGRPKWRTTRELLVPVGSRRAFTMDVIPAAAIHAAVGESPLARAYLARRERSSRPVAMLGPSRRSIRRFIEADPMLDPVADPNDAAAVICIRAEPPADKPAVVLDPRFAPRGWRKGEPIGPLTLAGVDVAADDPVMAEVDLAGVAVRRMTPWVATGDAKQVRLATLDRDAIALRTADTAAPRRVWIAIDPAVENTDLAVHYPLLVWLNNAMRFVLGEVTDGRSTYEARRATPSHPGWQGVSGGTRPESGVLGPGVYSAGHQDLRAVNLLGLRSGRPPREPVTVAREVPLPAPTQSAEPIALWWVLATLAGACWLAGWFSRRVGA